jgi:hypothetical protein
MTRSSKEFLDWQSSSVQTARIHSLSNANKRYAKPRQYGLLRNFFYGSATAVFRLSAFKYKPGASRRKFSHDRTRLGEEMTIEGKPTKLKYFTKAR